jgi:nitroreductase
VLAVEHASDATPPFRPHRPYVPPAPAAEEAARFYEIMRQRRSVREFSDRPVDRTIIDRLIAAAGTAPSGANKQPWRFVAVQDADLKREIRVGAEEEERLFYERRASETWLRDLYPLGTDEHKPFLEIAPWLIVMFKLVRDDQPGSASDQVYYINESVGIAAGMLITAIHMAGLVTLTHTPSPMKFLAKILRRPEYERPFLLLPVGYPADDCRVPEIGRKPLDEIMVVDRGDE